MSQSQNHIDTVLARATEAQKQRARKLANDFAALSGLQPHTCPDGYRLALFNIVENDGRTPVPPASNAGTVPTYLVPLNPTTKRIEKGDARILLNWLLSWPESVLRVRLYAPVLNEEHIESRQAVIDRLQEAFPAPKLA